jgi:hypothetical protein
MIPFQPFGKTIAFTAATPTAPTAVQPTTYNGVRAPQLMLTNVGAVTVFVAVSGASSADAIAKAVAPTGTAQDCFPVLAGTQVVVSIASDNYITGVSASSTAVVYVTPGTGS